MSVSEQILIGERMRVSLTKNFETPTVYRYLEQVRFYSAVLCLKFTEYESMVAFVPTRTYELLEQYSVRQNSSGESTDKKNSH